MMNETQKVGYLLSGIRSERTLQSIYVSIQQSQIRGGITFDEACADLHYRCEAIRAGELLSTPIHGAKKALITTKGKRTNNVNLAADAEKGPCLAKDCTEMIKSYLPLCSLHYHQCVSGKASNVDLKDNLRTAKYDEKSNSVIYPPNVPASRLAVPKAQREKKGPNRKLGLVAKLP